jgi:hypothetical protein
MGQSVIMSIARPSFHHMGPLRSELQRESLSRKCSGRLKAVASSAMTKTMDRTRLDRMRLANARLGRATGETKETKQLTPFQKDAEEVFFILKHQFPTNKRMSDDD